MAIREFESILKQVRRVIDDSDGIRWKDAVLEEYINEGQIEFCRESKTLRAYAPLTTRANSEIYTLPDDLYETIRVERTDGVELVKSTSYDLGRRHSVVRGDSSWRGGTLYRQAVGVPTHYYQDLDGEKLLRFYPRPTEDLLAKYIPFENEDGVIGYLEDINDEPVPLDQEEGAMTDLNAQLEEINPPTDEDFTVFDFEEGVTTSILTTQNVVNVFYVRYPRENKLEISDERALRYYTLCRIYEEDSPFQDLQKSEFYNDKFWSRVLVERGRVQSGYHANQRVRGEYY